MMLSLARRAWYRLVEHLAGRDAVTDLTRLLGLLRKPRWTTPVLLVLGLLSSLAETIGITLILLFFYTAMGQGDPALTGFTGRFLLSIAAWFGNSAILAAAILAMIVARATITYVYNVTTTHIGEGISHEARRRIHEQYLSLEFGFLQEREANELMETLNTETWLIPRAYHSWTRLMINGCSVVVFTIVLVSLSWKIAVVAIGGSAAITLLARRFTRHARARGARLRTVHRALGRHMLMSLQGMRTIRAYGQEDPHQRRFTEISEHARDASVDAQRMTAWLPPIVEVGYLGILCVIIAGASWWGTGFAVTLGAVVLLYRLQPHVREIESNVVALAQIQPQLASVRAMMDKADKTYPAPGTLPFAGMAVGIRFEDVDFAYPRSEQPVLSGIGFTIPTGRTTALIGASGAGKSSVVNLLLRLYDPGAGRILVDGVPLGHLRRGDWLASIGVAGQDVDLVEGTVIDNIRMADASADAARIIAAARAAGVADFVEPLEAKYDTWIGQEGTRFSGGQRQRIGLARALLRDPAFLILDEAMSALDQALEERIRQEIATRMAGRTVLLITHRIEMVAHADHVVWLEAGRVREEGPPGPLLERAMAKLGHTSVDLIAEGPGERG